MTCFAVVWWTWAYDDKFLPKKRWSQLKSRIVNTHFESIVTLNKWETIAETRSYNFGRRSRCRRRCVCVNCLIPALWDLSNIALRWNILSWFERTEYRTKSKNLNQKGHPGLVSEGNQFDAIIVLSQDIGVKMKLLKKLVTRLRKKLPTSSKKSPWKRQRKLPIAVSHFNQVLSWLKKWTNLAVVRIWGTFRF